MTSGLTLIVGGGLAGLAAAAGLARHNRRVLLLESRPRLGGRASSIVDQETGTQIDNCQHVSLGCCTNFRYFCEFTGLAPFLRTESKLFFAGPDGRIFPFSAGMLPAPLHLTGAFLRLGYLTLGEKRALARGLRQLAKSPDRVTPGGDERSFADWLHRQDQPPRVIDRFWNVVLVSALSESLERISVAHARKVFVDAFLAHRRGWEMQIPLAPLDVLYGEHLTGWLTFRQAEIRLQAGVQRIVFNGQRVAAVELRNGEQLAAENYILAVPHHLVSRLLPEEHAQHPQVQALANIESAPISSVHLWFDRRFIPLPHAVLIDRLSHWVFDRSDPQDHGRAYYQVVISASRHLAGRPQQEVIDDVVRELSAIWPEAGSAKLLASRMLTEHRAVFSPLPGAERHRPPQQSPWENLQWAGDWTATGWPATMEGAVRSGFLAAENILRRDGISDHLLQPDLPVARFSRWLMGIDRRNA